MEVWYTIIFVNNVSQLGHKCRQLFVLQPWDLELNAHVEYLEAEAENLIKECIIANENAAGTYKCTFSFNGAVYTQTCVL